MLNSPPTLNWLFILRIVIFGFSLVLSKVIRHFYPEDVPNFPIWRITMLLRMSRSCFVIAPINLFRLFQTSASLRKVATLFGTDGNTLHAWCRFSEVPKLYGPFSGVTIPSVPQERRGIRSLNFTDSLRFVTLKHFWHDFQLKARFPPLTAHFPKQGLVIERHSI